MSVIAVVGVVIVPIFGFCLVTSIVVVDDVSVVFDVKCDALNAIFVAKNDWLIKWFYNFDILKVST